MAKTIEEAKRELEQLKNEFIKEHGQGAFDEWQAELEAERQAFANLTVEERGQLKAELKAKIAEVTE